MIQNRNQDQQSSQKICRNKRQKTIYIERQADRIQKKWNPQNKITQRRDQYSLQMETSFPQHERKQEIKCSDQDPSHIKNEQQASELQVAKQNNYQVGSPQNYKLTKKRKKILTIAISVLVLLILSTTLIIALTVRRGPNIPSDTSFFTVQYRGSQLKTSTKVFRSEDGVEDTLLQGTGNKVQALSMGTQVSTSFLFTENGFEFYQMVIPIFPILSSIWNDWIYQNPEYKNVLDIINQNPTLAIQQFQASIRNQFNGKYDIVTFSEEYYGNIKYNYTNKSFELLRFDKQERASEDSNVKNLEVVKAPSQPQTKDQTLTFQTIINPASKYLLKILQNNRKALKRDGQSMKKFLDEASNPEKQKQPIKNRIDNWKSALMLGCMRLDQLTFRCTYQAIKKIVSEGTLEFQGDRVYTYAFSLFVSTPAQ